MHVFASRTLHQSPSRTDTSERTYVAITDAVLWARNGLHVQAGQIDAQHTESEGVADVQLHGDACASFHTGCRECVDKSIC